MLSRDVIRLSKDIALSGSNAFLTLSAISDIALETLDVLPLTSGTRSTLLIPEDVPPVLPLESELSSVGSVSLFIWSKPASDLSISLAVFLAALPISPTLSAALDASSPIPAISELIEPIEVDTSAPVSICTKFAKPSATFCNPANKLLKPRKIGVNNAMKPLPREAFNCSNLSDSILV